MAAAAVVGKREGVMIMHTGGSMKTEEILKTVAPAANITAAILYPAAATTSSITLALLQAARAYSAHHTASKNIRFLARKRFAHGTWQRVS
jgi:6-phosphogluconate dehydrogenase